MPERVNTKISKANFAKLAGVGRASVTLSVQRGKLIETGGLIDTTDPVNAEYLQERTRKKNGGKPVVVKTAPKPTAAKEPSVDKKPEVKKTAKKKPAPIEPLDDDFDSLLDGEMTDDEVNQSQDMGALSIQKLRAEIIYKREAAEAYRAKRLAMLGVLVEAEQVRQLIGKFNAELKIRLLEFPKSAAVRIVAMVKAGADEHEIGGLLEDSIATGIENAKQVFIRSKIGAA